MSRGADILLVRHGQSTYNAQGRWTGSVDAPLTERGERDVRAAAACLTGVELDAVASSDLERARRTAELFAEVLGLGEVVLEARLRERSMGEWEGLTRGEIAARWPDLFEAHRAGRLEAPPGGEPLTDFLARVQAALSHLAVAFEGRRLLVVAHGGVLRTLDRALQAVPVSVVNCGGRWYRCGADGMVAGEGWLPEPDGPSS